jgi:uncharacterized protein YjbI with pentapeptide repeats
MAQQGQGEHGAERDAASEERCAVIMGNEAPCGRRPHEESQDVSERPVCLMHSPDPGKSATEFQNEFERTLEEAHEGLADFTRFVFPSSGYSGRKFLAKCTFQSAVFTQVADFGGATFTRDADFGRAKFTRHAYFSDATFEQVADFREAKFTPYAFFTGAKFTRHAYFSLAKFTWAAYFNLAEFTLVADFRGAEFTQGAYFGGATFTQDAEFSGSTFEGQADFRRSRFAGSASFEITKFSQDSSGQGSEPGPIFTNSKFAKPEEVTFYHVDLGQALFHKCDASKMNFSDVTWRKRPNGKRMVFDEAVRFDPDDPIDGTAALAPGEGDPNPRNYRLIAELYQQLKKNYDDRRDYWTAGDFHYGEMEMKRLYSPRQTTILRWLHRNLGLVAWYKRASEYGESYVRPVLWLLVVLLVFALLYPAFGLRYKTNGEAESVAAPSPAATVLLTYAHPSPWSDDKRPPWRARWALACNSAMTTLYVAAFQKDLTYEPSYPGGRLLALLEVLLTSTLGALFLLAVRRQFKR